MALPAQKTGTLIVLVGPSGVGKSTISRKLAEKMHLNYIVTATTRIRTPQDDAGKVYELPEPGNILPSARARRVSRVRQGV